VTSVQTFERAEERTGKRARKRAEKRAEKREIAPWEIRIPKGLKA